MDGDESYSLFSSPDFGPPENAHHENEPAAASSWGSGVSPGSGRDFHPENYPAAVALQDPHDLDVVSRTSAHTMHPHVVSVRLTRPITDHVTFAPRTPPPPTTVVAELAVGGARFDFCVHPHVKTYCSLTIVPHLPSTPVPTSGRV